MKIEEILAIDDASKTAVEVPEWGNAIVHVWSMTAAERCEMERKWAKEKAASNPAGFRCDVLACCLKQDDGSPLGTREQIEKLMTKNAAAIERLFSAACRVSALTKEDVESLEKN